MGAFIKYNLVGILSILSMSNIEAQNPWANSYRYYQIELDEIDDSLTINYKVEFVDEELGKAIYETASLDSFLLMVNQDYETLPDSTNQPVFYIHGMFGNQTTVLEYSKIEMRSLFQTRVNSDIGRFFVIRWPAHNPIYKVDKDNAHQLAPQFANTFSRLIGWFNDMGIKPDVLAHSLGNEFLMKMYSEGIKGNTPIELDKILLCAPDLDTDVLSENGTLSGLDDLCNMITVYHSHQDMTLAISSRLNKKGRLGLDGPDTYDCDNPKLICIDVSDIKDEEDFPLRITGHSYYRSSPIITRDMAMALMSYKPNEIKGRKKLDEGCISKFTLPVPSSETSATH